MTFVPLHKIAPRYEVMICLYPPEVISPPVFSRKTAEKACPILSMDRNCRHRRGAYLKSGGQIERSVDLGVGPGDEQVFIPHSLFKGLALDPLILGKKVKILDNAYMYMQETILFVIKFIIHIY